MMTDLKIIYSEAQQNYSGINMTRKGHYQDGDKTYGATWKKKNEKKV